MMITKGWRRKLMQLCVLAVAAIAVSRESMAGSVKAAACYACITAQECDKVAGGVTACIMGGGACTPSSQVCGS